MVVEDSDKLGYHQKWTNAGWNWVAYQEMAENINIDENDNFSDFRDGADKKTVSRPRRKA